MDDEGAWLWTLGSALAHYPSIEEIASRYIFMVKPLYGIKNKRE